MKPRKFRKHSRHLRAGNLVKVDSYYEALGFAPDETRPVWERNKLFYEAPHVRVAPGTIGLILETGKQPADRGGEPFCVILFEEVKMKFFGEYWFRFKRV